jgi:hypothetical protein
MKPFTSVAVLVFTLVAIVQLLRVALGWDVSINGVHIPSWASVLICLVTATLAFMLWRERRP